MKSIFKLLISSMMIIVVSATTGFAKTQDIQTFTADYNGKDKETYAKIEAAFKANGFTMIEANDMNKPFKAKFKGGDDYHTYRLMFAYNPKLTTKLADSYPSIGLLAPLTGSIYSKHGKKITISTLSLNGMSKITGIPTTNRDLINLQKSVQDAMKSALPSGKFVALNYDIKKPTGELISSVSGVFDPEEDLEEAKEGFQEEFEGEMETAGFVIAGFNAFNEDMPNSKYDFFDTYSICKLDVIYPAHKLHPEVGAFAPCTLYMYKKKGEKEFHMAFPTVHNWLSSANINNDASIKPLLKAQKTFTDILDSMTEE
jgi:uncharacterized protein (DUF302 family)